MKEADIRGRVRELAIEMAPSGVADGSSVVTEGTRLADDLQYDSLALIELAVALERELDLRPIAEERAMEVRTVGQIEDLVIEALPQEQTT
jgi:acyl carrier protein